MSQLSAAAFAGRMRWAFGGLAGIMAGLFACLLLLGAGVFPKPALLEAEISGISASGLSFGFIIACSQCLVWNRSFHGREAGRLLSYLRSLYGLAFLWGVLQSALSSSGEEKCLAGICGWPLARLLSCFCFLSAAGGGICILPAQKNE